MHINSISAQNFGMAKVSEKAYDAINQRYGKDYADNFVKRVSEAGGDLIIVEDIYNNSDNKNTLPCTVSFPQKYKQGLYVVNLGLSEPLKRNMSLTQDAFFKDVRNYSSIKGGLSKNLEELKTDFPGRQHYINALFNKARPEMRNQEELEAIRTMRKK